jgi:hypothetical protein
MNKYMKFFLNKSDLARAVELSLSEKRVVERQADTVSATVNKYEG